MKTYVRMDLDAKTLDEIDQRSLALGVSRSDYVAMLVEKHPQLIAVLQEVVDTSWDECTERFDKLHALLKACQSSVVTSSRE